jgi:hypothetical protein
MSLQYTTSGELVTISEKVNRDDLKFTNDAQYAHPLPSPALFPRLTARRRRYEGLREPLTNFIFRS